MSDHCTFEQRRLGDRSRLAVRLPQLHDQPAGGRAERCANQSCCATDRAGDRNASLSGSGARRATSCEFLATGCGTTNHVLRSAARSSVAGAKLCAKKLIHALWRAAAWLPDSKGSTPHYEKGRTTHRGTRSLFRRMVPAAALLPSQLAATPPAYGR